MKFKNNSPHGDLDVVGVGPVAAGDTFEATGDQAQSLLAQGFERVDEPKTEPKAAAARRSSTTAHKEK